jgi:hypothetical protein
LPLLCHLCKRRFKSVKKVHLQLLPSSPDKQKKGHQLRRRRRRRRRTRRRKRRVMEGLEEVEKENLRVVQEQLLSNMRSKDP